MSAPVPHKVLQFQICLMCFPATTNGGGATRALGSAPGHKWEFQTQQVRFRPFLSGKSASNLSSCSLLARQQTLGSERSAANATAWRRKRMRLVCCYTPLSDGGDLRHIEAIEVDFERERLLAPAVAQTRHIQDIPVFSFR